MENLAEYVKRIMREKNIRPVDIERDSDGRIKDSYLASIISGKSKNITVGQVQALAEGLGVTEEEIFRVARQIESRGEMMPETH